MKKKTKILLIVVTSIVLLGTIFAITDFFRTKADKKPIFAINTSINAAIYRVGDSKNYWGLGYKVASCNNVGGKVSFHFGFYNMNVDKLCSHNPITHNDSVSLEIIQPENPENCNKGVIVKDRYYAFEDYFVYTHCIDKIYINFKDTFQDNMYPNGRTELKTYLRDYPNAIDYIINNMTPVKVNDVWQEGEIVQYQYADYSIMKCNTASGIKDIYIAPEEVLYYIGFCNRASSATVNKEYIDIAYNFSSTATQKIIINKYEAKVYYRETSNAEPVYVVNKAGKNITIIDKSVIIVDFQTNRQAIPNNYVVVLDENTNELLGFGLLD